MCGPKKGKGRWITREIQIDPHTTDTVYKIDNQWDLAVQHKEYRPQPKEVLLSQDSREWH